jgi:hypothetical protein
MVELTMSKINMTKLLMNKYFIAKLEMIELTMSKINMVKLTNE